MNKNDKSETDSMAPSVFALGADTFSLAAPVAAQDRAFVSKHLFAEQVRLLYRFSLVGYLAELMVTFLLGAILWNDLGTRPELFGWFALVFVVMIARYGTYKWFIKANPTSDALVTWERRFIAGSIAIALLWGLMGSLLLPKAGPTTWGPDTPGCVRRQASAASRSQRAVRTSRAD